MIIRCETNNDWNRFYLPDINSMQELKEYADKNIPVECYMLGGRHRHSIYLEEDMRFVHLYLNNYLQYYEITAYILTEEKLDKINKTVCLNCYNNHDYDLCCKYIKEELGCKNYIEKPITISKFKKFISKFL